MAKEFAKPFYKSQKWKKCREAFVKYRIAVDGGICEDCGDAVGEIVHHKILLTERNIGDADVTLNFRNLKYVCQRCHNLEEHNYGRKKIQYEINYGFDANGNPMVR